MWWSHSQSLRGACGSLVPMPTASSLWNYRGNPSLEHLWSSLPFPQYYMWAVPRSRADSNSTGRPKNTHVGLGVARGSQIAANVSSHTLTLYLGFRPQLSTPSPYTNTSDRYIFRHRASHIDPSEEKKFIYSYSAHVQFGHGNDDAETPPATDGQGKRTRRCISRLIHKLCRAGVFHPQATSVLE